MFKHLKNLRKLIFVRDDQFPAFFFFLVLTIAAVFIGYLYYDQVTEVSKCSKKGGVLITEIGSSYLCAKIEVIYR